MLAAIQRREYRRTKGAAMADEDKDGDKKFNQDDLNRVAANRAAEATRAAEARIAATLGMSPEEAQAKLAKATAAEREAMSAGERLAAAEARAEQATRDAEERIRATTAEAAARVELATSGIPANSLDKVLRMVDTSPNAKPVPDQIAELKTDLPALFQTGSTTEPVGTPAGSKTKPPTAQTATVEQQVADRLARFNLGGNK